MASVNKLVLVGNVGADPEMRTMPSGNLVANFNVATSERRMDRTGGHVDVKEWHRVAVYGKQAEVVRQYVRKGTQIYVEGKLRTNEWKDKNGLDRRTWSVIADRMIILGAPPFARHRHYSSRQ